MNPDKTLNIRQAYTSTRSDILSRVPQNALRILDVGCSNGALGAALRAMVPERIVEGIEFNSDFCREAATKLHRVIQADLNDFDWNANFAKTSFDCIVFADVLEHVTDPWRLLGEAVRHLGPGATVIVSIPNIRHVSAINSIVVNGVFPRRDRGLFDRTHLRWFTSKDARQLLASSGLIVESVSATLRINDIHNTSLNRFVERYLQRYEKLPWIREFLGYQIVLVGKKR